MSVLKKIFFVFACHFICLNIVAQQEVNNTKKADSLDEHGKYVESLPYRTHALEEINHTEDYKKHIEAKWHYTKSCIYETTGGRDNHKKALKHSTKAKEILSTSSNPSNWFNYKILNRIYHQYGYTQDWKNAFIEAKEALKILQDSLPDKHPKALLIIDDLGFVSVRKGDYHTAISYYEKSNEVYQEFYKEKKYDLASNYNVLAGSYRALGMRKKELELLHKSGELFLEDNRGNYSSFHTINKKLFTWYLYYGNHELAETYLKRQHQYIDSVKHKKSEYKNQRRHKYLLLYINYIKLALKKNDFITAKKYIYLSENELQKSTKEFVTDVSAEAAIQYYKSQLPDITGNESVDYIKKAIKLTEQYQERFFLNPLNYKINLFKKYKELKRLEDAEQILNNIVDTYSDDNEHKLFYLKTNYAFLLAQKNEFIKAKTIYKDAYKLLVAENTSGINLEQISNKDLKPLASFEVIDGILLSADSYFNQFENSKNEDFLKVSFNLYLLASDVFNSFYLGERYNENLYTTYKSIENGLIKNVLANSSKKHITKAIEAIENNASKLTWSKFVYSNTKHSLNIPDSILTKESELKSLINYYQNNLFLKDKKNKLETDTLKNRLANLKLDLKDLQTEIKNDYSNYYTRNYNTFNLNTFRETLNKNQLVAKYTLNNNSLFCFTISKSEIKISKIKVDSSIKDDVSIYAKALSTFNANISSSQNKLLPIIQPILEERSYSEITIIPDEVLSYLPFETLLPKEDFSSFTISYASSLTLLSEQNTFENKDKPNIGIFSANNTSSELPSVTRETHSVLESFSGKKFSNTSKEEFFSKANTFNMLHLAMHSNINNSNSDFSNLEFSDGNLLISELYNETLNAKLVVLSACDTGNGNIENGEGIQSISRAFTYAGVPSTVMSLWKVDDEATAKIMSAFYKHLNKGEAKDEALKNAKLDYLENTPEVALQHPYYWAGFVISGNTDALVTSSTNYIYIGIAILFAIMLFFFFRKKLQFIK